MTLVDKIQWRSGSRHHVNFESQCLQISERLSSPSEQSVCNMRQGGLTWLIFYRDLEKSAQSFTVLL